MKIKQILAAFITTAVLLPTQVYGLSQSQKNALDSAVYYFNTGELGGPCSVGAGTNNSGTLSQKVPAVWRNLILGAAPKYPGVDPRIVAAVLWVEHRGWPEYKTSGWAVSSAGAKGPWQMIDSTWASLGTDGDGDGIKDPDNPKDAVHAAFKHNLESAGKPVATEGYSGNAEADFNTVVYHANSSNLLAFAGKYNGSGAPDGVKLIDFPRGQNPDYVIMAYWLLATDFTKGYILNTGSEGRFVDAATSGEAIKSSSTAICPGNGLVNTSGYSFPVAPQRKSQNGGVNAMSPLPCNASSCHHDGSAAFDISRQPGGNEVVGTPVYAISDGQTVRVRTSYNGQEGCQSFQLVSKDGYWYWYGHVQKVSTRENGTVSAGQQVGVIGERRCTAPAYSDPHLHIDRGYPKGQEGGTPPELCLRPGNLCRDPGINPLINSLFETLPE